MAADLENDPARARENAGVQATLGRINLALGNETGAMEGFRAARDALESVLNEDPGDGEARTAMMEVGMRLVALQAGAGLYQDALHSIEGCEERGRVALKSDPPPPGARRFLAEVLSVKAGVARALGRTDAALKAGAEAITVLKSLCGSRGLHDDDREALAVSYIAEAEILRDTGRLELAMDYLMPAAGLLVELAEEGERVTSRFELGRCYEAMAGILSRIGEAKDAADAADASQQLFRTLQKDDPAAPMNRYFLAKTLGRLARLGRDGGKLDEAIKQQQESVDILSGLTSDRPGQSEF